MRTGAKYKGGAIIKRNGDKFFITWNIANQVFNGNGTLAGKNVTVNWRSSTNTSGIVVYVFRPTESLKAPGGTEKALKFLHLLISDS